MTSRRVLSALLTTSIVVGALTQSKKSDLDKLAEIGQAIGFKARKSLPEQGFVSKPIGAMRASNVLPLEEKVRMRIQLDKSMQTVEITVVPGDAPGQVRLRGIVKDRGQVDRAIELANGTVGVSKTINELAVPAE